MLKTVILYALSSLHASIQQEVIVPAREAGQRLRLVGSEFFNGDRETNAGGVFVVRHNGDEDLFQRIVDTYPELEVGSLTEAQFKKHDFEAATDIAADDQSGSADTIARLRGELISLGGSVAVGSTEDQLREQIAAIKAAADASPTPPPPSDADAIAKTVASAKVVAPKGK